jgi:hypothetical protein
MQSRRSWWCGVAVALTLVGSAGCGDKEAVDTSPVDTGPAETTPEPVICEATLPANVWVVRDTQTSGAAGTVAWICAGGALTVDAPGGAFFVEDGGALVLDGADARVYARAGAAVTLNASGTEVRHEDGANIAVNAINELYRCDEVRFLTEDVPLGCDD